MSDVVISVENLSKRYLVGHKTALAEHSLDFRELISRNVSRFARKTRDMLSGHPLVEGDTVEEFWALNDVSFEVRQGERLGIIGRNGSGKSTLLKVLSRITEPSAGRVRLYGRVASLLEVGTGFHPDLSGRENLYLNGAILGMRSGEIRRKLDEIVAFAGVEKFIDIPVKRYSSGMYVRLAFSVAAHLEPDILIIDEVLAVGDAGFQKKCINLMQQNSRQGHTILFVSHSMAAVRNLCNRAICLENGRILSAGKTDQMIANYLDLTAMKTSSNLANRNDRTGSGVIRFTSIELLDPLDESLITATPSGADCLVRVKLAQSAAGVKAPSMQLEIGIDDPHGSRIAHLSNTTTNQSLLINAAGEQIIDIRLSRLALAKGDYRLTLFATIDGNVADWVQDAGTLSVVDGDFFGTGRLPPDGQGLFYLPHSFSAKVRT
jgi:lipopolysaccharide transport system ATP-binding protein